VDEARPRRPDFFIVGAPKSGTTAMYEYLRAHPQLFLPARKELRFFGTDLEIRDRHRMTLDEYLAHFAGARDARRVGTAYVWYLFSRGAAREIAEFSPDATIIVMLRNPVEMLPALHAEHLANGNEDIPDFVEALDAEPDRRAGRRIPPHAHLPQGLLYSEVPRYSEQLDRYFQAFGRDRVRIVLFDEFQADTAGTYRALLTSLGVDASFAPDSFEVINPRRRVRSERLRHFLARPPAVPRRLIGRFVPACIRRPLYERARRMNVRTVARAPLSPEAAQRLRSLFAPEVERLSTLLGVDLRHWTTDG
jgi:hypothetical protein